MIYQILQEQENQSRPHVVIVTGYSGAGKSTVLRALEDIGFFCVDNLPIELLDSLFQLVAQSKINGQRLALGIDIRSGANIELFIAELKKLSTHCLFTYKIFFLTSSSPVLVKRFQETRRKHPLADDIDLVEAIEREKILLQPLVDSADLLLDTDQFNIHQLRSYVRTSFVPGGQQKMLVSLMSFGFKYGVPLESNFVYDVRSLPNPYFVPELKPLNGTQEVVVRYLFEQPAVQEYWDKLVGFIQYTIEKSHAEGRFFMNIAIGCTGGKHRSVAFIEKLATLTLPQVTFLCEHRDITKDRYESHEEIKEVNV